MSALPSRQAAAEGVGTALLLMAVVGSGIMAQRLAAGNDAIALLANTLATGAVLVAVIVALGPLSGAHLNPVVTVAEAVRGSLEWRRVGPYVAAQVSGAIAGVWIAHAMFGEAVLMASGRARSGPAQALSEFVAAFGLILVVQACGRRREALAPFAVAAYIVSAYWFTASTSFANPAATLARAFTDTFSGIRLLDVPVFIAAQCAGAASAVVLHRWLHGTPVQAAPQAAAPGPPALL